MMLLEKKKKEKRKELLMCQHSEANSRGRTNTMVHTLASFLEEK